MCISTGRNENFSKRRGVTDEHLKIFISLC